jgi:hypothetical protein
MGVRESEGLLNFGQLPASDPGRRLASRVEVELAQNTVHMRLDSPHG